MQWGPTPKTTNPGSTYPRGCYPYLPANLKNFLLPLGWQEVYGEKERKPE